MSERPWPARSALPLALGAFAVLFTAARLRLLFTSPREAAAAPLGEPWVWWVFALAFFIGPCLSAGRRGGGGAPAIVACLTAAGCACLGVGLAQGLLLREEGALAVLRTRAVSALTLTITRVPSPTDEGSWSAAEVRMGEEALGSVWVSTGEPLEMGETLRAVGRFAENEDDSWGRSSRAQGIVGTVKVLSVIESSPPHGLAGLVGGVRAALLTPLHASSSPGAALMAASALGERSALKAQGLDDAFSAVGLSHLVAVSGLHVSLVLGLLGALLSKTRWGPAARVAALLLAGGAYVLVAGSPASALRSFGMVGSAQLAKVAKRRAWSANALGLGGMAMVLFDVRAVGDIGFCLSALCVGAICLLSPWLSAATGTSFDRPERRRRHLARKAAEALARLAKSQAALALLCTIVAAPLVSSSFGEVSLLAPVASVLISLPFELFLGLSLLSCLFGWVAWVGPALIALGSGFGACLIACIRALGSLPFASVAFDCPEPLATLLPWATVFGFWAWWPRVSGQRLVLYAGTGAVAAFGAWLLLPLLAGPRIVVLDVGQGDAILVQDGFHALLVDTGPDDSAVEGLLRHGVLSLDGVVLTHQHADHAGGIDELAGSVRVGAILVPEGQKENLAEDVKRAERTFNVEAQEIRAGDELSVGAFRLRMIWPKESADGDENDESLVLDVRCRSGDRTLTGLITGDAESDVLEALDGSGELHDVDFLKVGHHGSAVSVSERSARVLRAEVAVASAGEGNPYGHPTPECVEILEGAGSRFLCTIDAGDVEIRPGRVGPRVIEGANAVPLLG